MSENLIAKVIEILNNARCIEPYIVGNRELAIRLWEAGVLSEQPMTDCNYRERIR